MKEVKIGTVEFWKQLREVNRMRNKYLEVEKRFKKLFKKAERCMEKLKKLEGKNSLWSSVHYLFLFRRALKSWDEVKVEKAIMDMCLDKWQMELSRL